MARKKRQIPEQFKPAPAPIDKPKVAYQDHLQSNVNRRVEDYGRKFEGKGKNILYGLAALAVLASLIGIFSIWNRRTDAAAQTALGKAIETSQAQVTDSPVPATSTGRTFKTERERTEASISEFQSVADKFGNPVKEKAKYFVAVNRLRIDRPAAVSELEELAKGTGEVGTLSKFALAQARTDDGKLDDAAEIYRQMSAMDNSILAKDTINFELAKIYQKQGKTDEAADIYFNIAKTASEAKDLEDKPIPLSETARDAKKRLEELNPEKAKEIKEPEIAPPTGISPFGAGGLQ